MDNWVPGSKFKVVRLDGSQVLVSKDGVNIGWINKSDIVGYASGTSSATRGLHEIYEKGYEHIFESADGNKYRMFSGGEKVLNANATSFLYDFATSGGALLYEIFGKLINSVGFSKITPKQTINNIDMGDVIVQGRADQQTVSEIRRSQRENLGTILKSLQKLNK
jgi:hypothetical protein